MTGEGLIQYYNRLNGNSARLETLKRFHGQLQNYLDAEGHGPYVKEIKGIYERLTKAIKKAKSAGVDFVERIELDVIRIKDEKAGAATFVPSAFMLDGLEEIADPQFNEGGLDGFSDTAYKVITDKLIELIEGGGLAWRQPWNSGLGKSDEDKARNYVTGHVYRGGNFYLNFLRMGAKVGGKIVKYDSPYFLTFKQATAVGGKVKQGEKAWPVIYFKYIYVDKKNGALVPEEVATTKDGELKDGYKKVPALFYYNVFNVEQCTGVPEKTKPKSKPLTPKEQIESCESIVEKMPQRPKIFYHGNRAFYRPSMDSVTVPEITYFDKEQYFYSTLFHELIHATGHPSRLNREKGKEFGDDKYAFEELIAELGACFLCGEAGILYYTMKNSAAYIDNWQTQLVRIMKADKKFFVKASGQAQAAADFILDKKADKVVEEKENFIDDIPADIATRAFNYTSFDPEKRGESMRQDYVATLEEFIEKIRPLAERVERLDEYKKDFDRFREKLKSLTLDYLHAHSRVASSFIVGPARFPTARNQKAGNAADKRMSELLSYPKRVMKVLTNKYLPDEMKPVKSGKDNTVAILESKLADRIRAQEMMTATNKIIRAGGDNVEGKLVELFKSYQVDDPEAFARKRLTPDYMGRKGFAPYALSNNNAEISRLKKRIEQEKAYGKKKEAGNQETVIGGVRVLKNYDLNRVQLFFDGKPADETIKRLKGRGFKWSPSNKAWQRFLNTTPDHLVKFVITGSWEDVPSKEPEVVVEKNEMVLAGFTTADQAPDKLDNVFTLPGEIGKFLGEQQRYRCQIVIDGEKSSSKSELVKQLADGFIESGFKTALIDYEMGGLASKDTRAGIDRNVKPENRKKLFVSPSDFPATLEAIRGIAGAFDCILIDSGSKLEQVTNAWLDELRVEFPDLVTVVLMHQNSRGGTKGGTAAGYNAPVVIKTYRPDPTNPLKNYAWVEKNRGNATDKWYMISQKKVVNRDPEEVEDKAA